MRLNLNGLRAGRCAAAAAVLAISFGAALAAGKGGQADWQQDPSTGCRFIAPTSLTTAPTYWTGACVSGKASGIGMLRTRVGAKAGIAFYGELRDGVPLIGAVDFETGYQVGRFVDGDIGAHNTEWQEQHDGFETALRAARMVSKHYSNAGNTASARYYDRVAKQLDMQLDRD